MLLLALPLSLGWHPVPTLGSLAEAVAVFGVALLLALSGPPTSWNLRRLWLGTGGLLGLLLLRCLAQALLGDWAYAGFWLGPMVVLATAFLICVYWPQRSGDWLRLVALAVLLAAFVNAVVGFLQYWRVSAVFDFLGPYLLYWDRSDGVAHGNVAQRNILASLCLLGIAASVYLLPRRGAPAVALAGFLAYVVALSASRTPWVIVLAVLLLALLRERHWRALGQPLVRWFVVPVLLAQLLAPGVNYFLFSLLDWVPIESSVARLSAHGLGLRAVFYQLAAELGLQAGVWGLGWKALPLAMVEQGFGQQLWGLDELPTHAHNILLHLWVENGPLLALLASLYPIWLLFKKGLPGAGQDYARLSLVVLIVHSWLEYPLWQPALFFLFVALMCTLELPEHESHSASTPPRLMWRGLAGALALGAAVTALQFGVVADLWTHRLEPRTDASASALAPLRLNPVTEPYADWLALNLNLDTPGQRVARLERLAHWLPDAMMLGLLADGYRQVGRDDDAERVEQRRLIVFGVRPQN